MMTLAVLHPDGLDDRRVLDGSERCELLLLPFLSSSGQRKGELENVEERLPPLAGLRLNSWFLLSLLDLHYEESEEKWLLSRDPPGLDNIAYLPTDATLPESDSATWFSKAPDGEYARSPAMESHCRQGPPISLSGEERLSLAFAPFLLFSSLLFPALPEHFSLTLNATDSKLNRRNSVVFQSVDQKAEHEAAAADDLSDGGLVAYNEKGELCHLFVGIIDILQNYGRKKQLEHSYKAMLYDGAEVSVHRPSFYRERFLHFMSTFVLHPDASGAPVQELSRTSSQRSQRSQRAPRRRHPAAHTTDRQEDSRPATSPAQASTSTSGARVRFAVSISGMEA